MKKRCILLCAALLVGCAPIRPPAAKTTAITPLTLCYSAAGTATQSLPFYASEKGIYAQYGLDVKPVYIEGGSKAAAALIAGGADICQVSGPSVVNSAVAGADLVLIAGLIDTYSYFLIVTPDIQSADDLRGKAVAISQPGSATDAAMRAALQSLGLRPDEEITMLSMDSEGNRLAAMASGAVAGTVVGVPMPARARELGFHTLVDVATLKVPFQNTALATSRAFIQQHRETALRFLQATIEATARMKQDKTGAMAAMAKFMALDVQQNAAQLEEAYTVYVLGYLPDMPYPTAPGVQTILDDLAAQNPAAASFTPARVIDASLLDEIRKR